MDEKTDASSEEELEQLGPYRIEEQVPQPDDKQGELYLATHEASGATALVLKLPREPFKGQKRPPCTRYAEVELIGACWTPHELKAPCPDVLYEYQGKCYVPAFSAKPPPQSLGQ